MVEEGSNASHQHAEMTMNALGIRNVAVGNQISKTMVMTMVSFGFAS